MIKWCRNGRQTFGACVNEEESVSEILINRGFGVILRHYLVLIKPKPRVIKGVIVVCVSRLLFNWICSARRIFCCPLLCQRGLLGTVPVYTVYSDVRGWCHKDLRKDARSKTNDDVVTHRCSCRSITNFNP